MTRSPRRRRSASLGTDSSSCTGSTSIRRCSIRTSMSRSSTGSPGTRPPSVKSARGSTSGAPPSPRSIARASTTVKSARASTWRRFSCRTSRRLRHARARTKRSASNAACSPTPTVSAGSRPKPTARSTTANLRRCPRWPWSGSVSPISAALDARFAPYLDQRDDLKSRLEDLAFFLRGYAGELDAAPDRLQAVEDRLAALERLKKKYGPSLAGVLARQAALREELSELGASEERAATLERRERETRDAFLTVARSLSAAREAAGPTLARALEIDLAELAMPKSRVEIRFQPLAHPDPGRDAGLTTRRSTSRRIRGRTCARWLGSPRAGNCRG